jgi:hypothetical protein
LGAPEELDLVDGEPERGVGHRLRRGHR